MRMQLIPRNASEYEQLGDTDHVGGSFALGHQIELDRAQPKVLIRSG